MITDDPELLAIAAKQRQKKLITAGIIVVIVVLGALKALPMSGAVVSTLERDGYSNVEVTRTGLFDFTYEATKGSATCSGSLSMTPGSTSRNDICSATRR